MKVTCQPILHREDYNALIENETLSYFREVVFNPLFEMLQEANVEVRENDIDPVRAAILDGRIRVVGGLFLGTFEAATSRELRRLGAVRVDAGFSLAQSEIPLAWRGAISEARQKTEDLHRRIIETLATMATLAAAASTGIHFAKTVDMLATDLQKQFVATVSEAVGSPEPLTLPPGLKAALESQLAQGTDLAIKDFTVAATTELRAKVQLNLQQGGRTDRLAQIIESAYGVAKRKAQFIAENETSLAVAQFREERYKSVGSTQYRWKTAGDSKVRPTHGESNNHRVLNDRIFSWSDPPIVDPATGRRRHPGCDYNCRCVPLPILNAA